MAPPMSINSLFAKLGDSKAKSTDPEWLTDDKDDKMALDPSRLSASSEDPFDLTVSPSKPPGSAAVQCTAGVSGPTTIKATSRAKAAVLVAEGGDTDNTGALNAAALAPQPATKAKDVTKKAGLLSTLQLKNPEKLVYQRLLVELPGGNTETVDLSGDAGAVGRLSLHESGCLLLDLKGVVFDATITAMPCTACIVNIGQAEGKVEAYFNEFVQVERSSLFQDTEVLEDGNIDAWTSLHYDDKEEAQPAAVKKAKRGSKDDKLGVSSGKVAKVAKASKGAKKAGAKKGGAARSKNK